MKKAYRVIAERRQGFTLIELLVVVLIIAVLSSVALVQYSKTVKRARLVEISLSLSTLAKAIDYWCLERGSECRSVAASAGQETFTCANMSELHVTLPSKWVMQANGSFKLPDGGIVACGNNGSHSFLTYTPPRPLANQVVLFAPIFSLGQTPGDKYRGRVYCAGTNRNQTSCRDLLGLDIGTCTPTNIFAGYYYGCSFDKFL